MRAFLSRQPATETKELSELDFLCVPARVREQLLVKYKGLARVSYLVTTDVSSVPESKLLPGEYFNNYLKTTNL